ncbi:ATP-dependent 6-phosphofructokinase [bioreactor metagenome]|uniref:ATP-dependent 6-phosphofructokinase n=1 Tax=bioreactor metagenome TaxID=1076179 RepID=A0A645HWL3_9ZZZZ
MLPVKTTIQETGVVADGRKFPVSVVKLVSYGEALCEYLNKQMELMNSGKSIIETKFMRPSHIQRGGVPTFRDRAISSLMGDKAIDLLMLGKSNLVVCMRKDEITSMDIDFALEVDRLFKGKTTIEALEKDFSADDIEKMKAIVEEKRASFYDIYDVNRTISL